MSTVSKGMDVCRMPLKKTKRKKCKHAWSFSESIKDGDMTTTVWICSKCGKADEVVEFARPKPKKKPIRKRVIRKVWRWFCPECGKQMSVEDYSGGGIHLKCSNSRCKHHTEWFDHP